jgi:hypothetical protein
MLKSYWKLPSVDDGHRGVMPSDTAHATTSHCTRTTDKDMRM